MYPYQQITRTQNRCGIIDTRELLKQEIYRQGGSQETGFNVGAGVGVSSAGPTTIGFEDIELYCDSTQGVLGDNVGEISWDVTIQNGGQDITNCIELHIGNFYFPKIYASPGKPEYFYFRRVFVELLGLPTNNYVQGTNGNRFHFEFEVENINGQAVKLVPIKRSLFLTRPSTSIPSFILRFTVPPIGGGISLFRRIPLPPSTIAVTSLLNVGIGYNPIRFRVEAPYDTAVLGPIGAPAAPGLAVFITNYNSNSSAVNASVNDAEGLYITNIIDTNTFEIAGIDATAVTAEITANMFVPKNRFAFSLRFTTVKYAATNYIDINHD